MSRICIKNLPKHASEDRLREFFSQKGEVTDAKLIRTTDGKSRQFGFIGYRTEEEAESAIKYFNNSFMDTCRITCEIARKAGDENLPRSWSKYSGKKIDVENKENSKKISSKKIKREDKKEEKSDDPLLQEFLEVMKPRSKSQLWANDTVTEQNNIKKKKIEKSDDSDEEEDDTSSIHNQSDMDYFKSRVKKDFSDSEIDEDESKSEVKELTEHEDEISSPKDDLNEVLITPRLFIRNLPYTTSEEELEDHFSKYGKLSEVHIVVDKETKRSKGIAYILYSDLDSATRALDELDNSTFQGRLLHVMPAKQKNPEKQEIDTLTKSKTFKQKREDERKASELNGNTQAWNSLFIRPDTVVENLARKYGVSKRDFLDKEADDLAVRIALGETQVISETKKALTKFGINVSSLEDFANGKSKDLKRSNHVILVKNLPYGSSESELANLFGKFGSLDKVILPNTKTLALVIFLEANEARSAFRGLAYKRYKDAPLYLEWAPEDILVKNFSIDNEELKSGLDYQIEEFNEEIDPDRIESRSIYVKNLNFKTSDESLKKHFIDHMKEGKLLSARVKKHLKNGKNVSMGFGFIEFDSVDTALNICKDLKGTVLDGHALILQLCHAKEEKVVKKKGDSDKSSTKLIVRNVAFEATVKDLRQLFSPFGQIKRLRLPMRFENHRGFAFVEYMTKQETLNALQALSNTHLYGRHLVLERAKEGESLEELRERTAAQFSDNLSSGKVSKKRDHLAAFNEGNDKF